jgi:hypothetical protein
VIAGSVCGVCARVCACVCLCVCVNGGAHARTGGTGTTRTATSRCPCTRWPRTPPRPVAHPLYAPPALRPTRSMAQALARRDRRFLLVRRLAACHLRIGPRQAVRLPVGCRGGLPRRRGLREALRAAAYQGSGSARPARAVAFSMSRAEAICADDQTICATICATFNAAAYATFLLFMRTLSKRRADDKPRAWMQLEQASRLRHASRRSLACRMRRRVRGSGP